MKRSGAAKTILAITLFLLGASFANAQEKVIYSFDRNGTDGVGPRGPLVFDKAGNLYGTTANGGTGNQGIVYELTPQSDGSWKETILCSCFDSQSGLTFDSKGNLYGSSGSGGGTIFELSPAAGGTWTQQVLYTFSGSTDGNGPVGNLIFDAAGNIYGTTYSGGANQTYGTVFELSPKSGGGWTEQILHSFNNDSIDGWDPRAGLVFDAKGNLYGTTQQGGANALGTVYELTPGAGGVWTEKVVYSFGGSNFTSYFPTGALIFDAAGNLYTTASSGGANNTDVFGTVIEFTPQADGNLTAQVLHSFGENGTDGGFPASAPLFDANKINLYGTTFHGGPYYYQQTANTDGSIYELLQQSSGGWAEQVLYFFGATATDGFSTTASLISDAKGNLYGTTQQGGQYGYGTVFEYTPVPTTALPVFSLNQGTYPNAQTVAITDTTTGATIYYTTDGTTPTTSSTQYTGPITVSATETIEAIAVASGVADSPVATATYTIHMPVAATPVFTPPTGLYTAPQSVTITDATAGAIIYYTTDGSTPTTASTVYSAPIVVSKAETISAIAVATGNANSAVGFGVYTFPTITTPPVFSPAVGTYATLQSVTLANHTANSTIYYTTDGTTPTTASTVYTAPITVSVTETIKAFATSPNLKNSAVVFGTYTITPTTATPAFSVAAGIYSTTQSVAITDSTSGAVIYYTTNGTTPTTSSAVYSAPISVSATETLQAIATATGYAQSTVASATFTIEPKAATPVFSPAAGTYATAQSVSITDSTSGAVIYYTLDGSTPTTSSAKYSAAISVSTTETIKAIAVASNYVNSTVASAAYTIGNSPKPAATPAISPVAGTYLTAKTISITDTTSGAAIYYTVDGSTPTASSTKYTAAFKIAATTTVKAIATATNYATSAVASSTFTITPVAATPVISPAAGTYTTAKTISITDTTSGASIYYTTNGSTPTASSTKYTAAFKISATTTVKAIAVATGYTNSAIASSTYTINLPKPTATPVIGPAAGSYATTKTITITDATSGATIYYTLNGSTPTTSSTKYTAAFKISASATVKAVAIASGDTISAVASSTYTITLPTATPTISPAAGTYTTAKTITMADTTTGATIYYTLDGSTPTASSTQYTAAFKITATTTIKAIAVASGHSISPVATSTYTIN